MLNPATLGTNATIVCLPQELKLVSILTGNSSAGFPVFREYILRKVAIASSFLPRDMWNLGLSGRQRKTIPVRRGTRPVVSKNMFHE